MNKVHDIWSHSDIGNKLENEYDAKDKELAGLRKESAINLFNTATELSKTLFAFSDRQTDDLRSCCRASEATLHWREIMKEAKEILPKAATLAEDFEYQKEVQSARFDSEVWAKDYKKI